MPNAPGILFWKSGTTRTVAAHYSMERRHDASAHIPNGIKVNSDARRPRNL